MVHYGDIPAGQIVSAEPFVFQVASSVPNETALRLDVDMSEEPGEGRVDFVAFAPAYLVGIVEVVGGDGNGIPDQGEAVEITLAIDNRGACDTPELQISLGSLCEQFLPEGSPLDLGILPVGGSATSGRHAVQISPICYPIFADYLTLDLSGPDDYQVSLPFAFAVGQPFGDAMEVDAVSWFHDDRPGSWADDWHRESHRNHSPEGAFSWKCGGPGDYDYTSLLCAELETGWIYLVPGSTLEFWHWMDAETSSTYPEYCYDGGLLEISTDGTTWSALTPVGGYPYLIRDGSVQGPFPAETPVWSGSHDWEPVTVDLFEYTGPIKLRWVFGSDGAVTAEGWYIDDVHIRAGIPAHAGGRPAGRNLPRLHPVRALAGGALEIRFTLPQAAPVRLAVYDASGRLVNGLAEGAYDAGDHVIAWDGRDLRARPLGRGTYFCRLSVAGRELTRKATLLK